MTMMDMNAFFKEHNCTWNSERTANTVPNADGSTTTTFTDTSKGLVCTPK